MAHPVQKKTDFSSSLPLVTEHILQRDSALSSTTTPILSSQNTIASALASLPAHLPIKGLGTQGSVKHLVEEVLPGILQGQNSARYYGFVVGGVTPAAQLADILVGSYDENVQVAMPETTASTAIEQRSLEMVLDLLDIPRSTFMGRTLTTGATSANVLGLTCARDHLYANSPHLPAGYSYAQDGPPLSPTLPSPPLIILSLHPHFSILKAASLVGIGASPSIVQTIPASANDELAFDLVKLEEKLKLEKDVGRGVIVVYGVGEVNTGGFGSGLGDAADLCKKYGSWLHVDAAFGGFAGLMPEIAPFTKDLDKADSLTLDGHKWLNVPYDCGIFYTKHTSSLTNVFQPPSASAPAYLATNAPTSITDRADDKDGTMRPEDITSPLYLGIENSRRFRALPLYASLISLGKEGYRDIITRNILFARRIATYIQSSTSYELLNPSPPSTKTSIIPSNIVLFRGSPTSPFPPSDQTSSGRLVKAINDTGKIYVSGTKWRGEGAVRIAVSNWRTGVSTLEAEGGEEKDGDWEVVKGVLEDLASIQL